MEIYSFRMLPVNNTKYLIQSVSASIRGQFIIAAYIRLRRMRMESGTAESDFEKAVDPRGW